MPSLGELPVPEHIVDGPCSCWGCIAELEVRNTAVSALSLLCEDRLRVDLVGYGEKPPVEFSLIQQLRSAAFTRGNESATAGSSQGTGLPLDVVAVEMYSTLVHELHDDAVFSGAVSAYSEPDAMTDAHALLGKVREIDPQWLEVRANLWKGWCQRIREYLAPTRRTPIPGQCPHPECRSEFWFTYDEEGGRISEHALKAVWVDDEVDGVECSCCFTFWPRRDLYLLANSLNPQLLLQLRGGSV